MCSVLRAINNARVVTPDTVVESVSIVLEEGRIGGLLNRTERFGGETLDAAGGYILPGMVDLHCDAIEKQAVPRPGVEFPLELAFLEMDRYFAASGITTGFHAISFMDDRGRSMARGRALCETINRQGGEGLVRHELHLRCELPQEGSVEMVEEVMNAHPVKIVSMMDHTPGQGQFQDLEWFKRYWKEDQGVEDDRIAAAMAGVAQGGYSLNIDRMDRLAQVTKQRGVTLASHDDDTPERVELLAERGGRISEFPINIESARRARELGLSVCMGAPNVVRGRSSGGNLGASGAVKLGLVDALCSDYHPPSMLQAAFKLARERVLNLPSAVGLISSGPARAAGLLGRGSIAEGAVADLIVVGERSGIPVVTHTIVNGAVTAVMKPMDSWINSSSA